MTDAAELTTRQFERTQYVRCYTIGHAWFDYDNSEWNPEFGTPLVLRCERCGSERRDSIGSSGQMIGRNYYYPDDYKYAKGMRPNKDEFRVMLLEAKRLERDQPKKGRR